MFPHLCLNVKKKHYEYCTVLSLGEAICEQHHYCTTRIELEKVQKLVPQELSFIKPSSYHFSHLPTVFHYIKLLVALMALFNVYIL